VDHQKAALFPAVMSNAGTPKMTNQEENFIHFVSCIKWLNTAWWILSEIKAEQGKGNQLAGAAFRFALIEYCKPYKNSRGTTRKNFKLDMLYIPTHLHPLHKRIVDSRDQIHAHSDLKVTDAKLHIHESQGQRYTLTPQNLTTGVEELINIGDILELIEGTLDNMYPAQSDMENALTP
jgi:hypothetical protein